MGKVQAIAYSFSYDPAISEAVRKEMLETVAKQSPVNAELLRDSLKDRDLPADFVRLMNPYGLRSDDLIDATLGYWLVMWSIIHDQPLPEPGPAIVAARKQIMGLLSTNPDLRKGSNESRRQMMGEAMISESVISLEVRDSTKARGNEQEINNLRESTHHNLMRRKMNLKAMQLTEQGFVRSK